MSSTTGRRRFLTRTASLFAAAAAASTRVVDFASPARGQTEQEKEQEKKAIPIIDTHQHLWDLSIFRLPWHKEGSPLARNFVMSDYLDAVAGLNVVKSIYMEVNVDPSQQTAEAEHVLAICGRGDTPMAAAVISGRPSSDAFEGYLRQFRDRPYLKGVRQVLHGADAPRGYCLDDRFIRGIRHLGKLGLSYDICLRPAELDDAAKLIDACPDTWFILDHCGNAKVRARPEAFAAWRTGIDQVAKRPHVVCKVSGIVASAAPGTWTPDDLAPIINHVLDTFGPDRVMFGGDWPVCTQAATYRQWVEALQTIVRSRSEADQRKLFHDNAFRFYTLS